MRIAGLEKCSLVDYPGKLAAVVFTPGCNMNCFYCHNRSLLHGQEQQIASAEVIAFLERRRGLLDGVVITGGEPTLQHDLEDFIRDVRSLGFEIKLDSNGTNPELLRRVIDQQLVDFVAMDIKAPLARYSEITQTTNDVRKISDSIDLLLQGRVEYEFRTTFAPQLSAAAVMAIAARIQGAQRYALQQYRQPVMDGSMPTPRPESYIEDTARLIRPFVKNVVLRGLKTQSTATKSKTPERMPALATA